MIKREKEIEYRIRVQDAEVARLSEGKIHDRMRQMQSDHQKRRADLDSKYKRMQSRYAGIVFMAVAYGLLVFFATRAYAQFFKDKQADEITGWAVLMDTAMVVFLADEIRSILSINLVLLFLLIFASYSLIRAILQAENTQVRNAVIKYAVIVGGSIAGVALMVHFFGVIGIIAIHIGLLLAGKNR